MFTIMEEEIQRLHVKVLENVLDAIENDNNLKIIATPLKWEQYVQGKITRKQILAHTQKRYIKGLLKRTEERYKLLEEARKAEIPETLRITADWTNPNLHVSFEYSDGTKYTITGDVCSEVIASGLNQHPGLLKILYELKEKELEKDPNRVELSNAKLIKSVAVDDTLALLPKYVGKQQDPAHLFLLLAKGGLRLTTFFEKEEGVSVYVLEKEEDNAD